MLDPVRAFWKRKQTAYRLSFGHEQGKIVLADLRTFCHANKISDSRDPIEISRTEGRREVFYRIMDLLKVDYEETYNMEEDIND